jgi:hypothetical protein
MTLSDRVLPPLGRLPSVISDKKLLERRSSAVTLATSRWFFCSTEKDMTLTLELDLPQDLARLRLPAAVDARLQSLLDRQDDGDALSVEERDEAEGLVSLAEFLTLLRLREERSGK